MHPLQGPLEIAGWAQRRLFGFCLCLGGDQVLGLGFNGLEKGFSLGFRFSLKAWEFHASFKGMY